MMSILVVLDLEIMNLLIQLRIQLLEYQVTQMAINGACITQMVVVGPIVLEIPDQWIPGLIYRGVKSRNR
ncbi:hypothetical protein D3C86_680320 [compost metagenome]